MLGALFFEAADELDGTKRAVFKIAKGADTCMLCRWCCFSDQEPQHMRMVECWATLV
jgi:hypothetical protein